MSTTTTNPKLETATDVVVEAVASGRDVKDVWAEALAQHEERAK